MQVLTSFLTHNIGFKTSVFFHVDAIGIFNALYRFFVSHFRPNMLRNRDTQRRNKANKAVQACLLSKLASDSIKMLRNNSAYSPDRKSLALLSVAETTNKMMTEYFCNSQSSINKMTCEKYANSQHSMIIRALKNNEPLNSVTGISEYVIDEAIIKAYQDFTKLSGK